MSDAGKTIAVAVIGAIATIAAALISSHGRPQASTEPKAIQAPAAAEQRPAPVQDPKENAAAPHIEAEPRVPEQPAAAVQPAAAQLAPTQSAPAPDRVSLVESYVGSVASGFVEVYARETRESLILRVRAWKSWHASLDFDVNQNHLLDPHIDVAYGFGYAPPGSNRPICTEYLLSQTGTSFCGVFRSSAVEQTELEAGGWVSTTWTIPKIEVSPDNTSAWLAVEAYNDETKEFIKPQLFDPAQTFVIPFRAK